MLGWFTVESSEVISISDLQYSDKMELLFWVSEEMNVLCELYKLNTKN